MIYETEGDILQAPTVMLVNPVNTHGVMGAGLALQVKRTYPGMCREYARRCQTGIVRTGRMDVHATTGPHRYIVNFPTEDHWRDPSTLEWIREGLTDLARLIRCMGTQSAAVPALGCGLGGLPWDAVRDLIHRYLGGVPAAIHLYLPPGADPGNSDTPGVEDPAMPPTPFADAIASARRNLPRQCAELVIADLAFVRDTRWTGMPEGTQRLIQELAGMDDPSERRAAADDRREAATGTPHGQDTRGTQERKLLTMQPLASPARAATLATLLRNGKAPDWVAGSGTETFYRHVAGLFDAGHVAPTDQLEHRYLSTGCLHGEHGYCQAMTGQHGQKRPGQCKFCDAKCVCGCHTGG